MTSHRGSGSTVLRASDRPACRQARMPATGRRGGRMSSAPDGVGDMGPVDGATDTVTGAEAQSLPPPDAKGSGWVDEPPIIKSRLVVATLPSSHFLQGPDRQRGVATTKHVRAVSEGDFRGDE